jgi:mRNA interferase RelE/StbE
MTWDVEVSAGAEKDLRRLPRDRRAHVERAMDEMERDPFAGDVKPLKGPQWKGRFRMRIGDYRIIFTVNHGARLVWISAILTRSEKTYR